MPVPPLAIPSAEESAMPPLNVWRPVHVLADPRSREMLPEVVIAPPESPVPALTLVTVPLPPPPPPNMGALMLGTEMVG